jgi:predicted nuclease of predicted toxin-antitoxin system
MKLLLDQNLSPDLVAQLTDLYPGSAHVYPLGLDRASDDAIWHYARQNDFIIVSKDADFSERSILLGPPPKVIWIRRGNCSTRQVLEILRRHYEDIKALAEDEQVAFLELL